jgi:regulator of cell morphogenesis and NO signaling
MQTKTKNILDVTQIEPRLKHPTIFEYFDALEAGETLIIHNDHDPKPLYYQLLGERGNIFKWQYTENGPIWWKVNITKNNINDKEETLGEIATKDLKKVEVFKKYGIDFCCGGKKTLKQVCEEKNLDIHKIEEELNQSNNLTSRYTALPYNDWELNFLADFIVNTHHSYVNKTMPELTFYANKVMKVHSGQHPELIRIKQLVDMITNELTTHMMKEEKILFPYVHDIVNAKKNNTKVQSQFGSIQNPINMMEMEHESVGEAYEEIKQLNGNYTLPADACSSYKILYKMLEEFENDLNLHIHLENNILFPKAIELEKSL